MLLGELLLKSGRIGEADLAGALRAQPSLGLKLGEILIRLGALSEDGLYEALAVHGNDLVLWRRPAADAEPNLWQAFVSMARITGVGHVHHAGSPSG